MQVMARDLYRALTELAPLPKTFEIATETVLTDLTTGKSNRKVDKSKHAVVRVSAGGASGVSVDFQKLRALARTIGTGFISIRLKEGFYLEGTYTGGQFALVDFKTSAPAELDLCTLEKLKEDALHGIQHRNG